jgi:dTDP-4-dehydrorhamnose reductase
MTHILVTGASGLLGINLALQAVCQYQVVGSVFSQELKGVPFQVLQADLTDHLEVKEVVKQSKPELIINCAALANVDVCEKESEIAESLNTILPQQLAEISKRENIRLIHISTDAVFDGVQGNYMESDHPNPLSIYARTKLQGEIEVQKANPDALIVRVNFYGFSLNGKRSLAEFFLYNLAAGLSVNGFTDVQFCPLLVQDLGVVLFKMIKRELRGIYHVVSPESLSKYDFGIKIARKFELNENLIIATSIKQGGLPALRSLNLTLRVDKLVHDLDLTPPGQDAGIKKLHQLFKNGYPEQLKAYLCANES